MTTEEIRDTILRMLAEIAPEVDTATVKPDVDFRDQFDLDSMDLLNFVIAVDQELGVDIPESDYGRFSSLDTFVAYVAGRTGTASGAVG